MSTEGANAVAVRLGFSDFIFLAPCGALASKNLQPVSLSADPEGAAQDVRRFSRGQDVP
jgi:hypothetical protein